MESDQCLKCARYLGALTCEAFPDGIREDILLGRPHDEPIDGDHGLQFVPADQDAGPPQ